MINELQIEDDDFHTEIPDPTQPEELQDATPARMEVMKNKYNKPKYA